MSIKGNAPPLEPSTNSKDKHQEIFFVETCPKKLPRQVENNLAEFSSYSQRIEINRKREKTWFKIESGWDVAKEKKIPELMKTTQRIFSSKEKEIILETIYNLKAFFLFR